MTEADDSDRYRAPALDKGLDILELLAEADEPLSQAEIAKALDRSPNEIYRMLDRLVRRDYVRRTAAERYEVTLKLFELGHARPPMRRLVSQAVPVMRQMALRAEQPCHLVVRDRNELVVVAQVDGPHNWNVSIRVGSHVKLVNSGSGNVFLAFADAEDRALMLEEQVSGQAQVLDRQTEAHLEMVRARGYETIPSMQAHGINNLSAPIFGPLGSVIAALTCPYAILIDRPNSPAPDAVLALLLQASRDISRRSAPEERGQGG
ncbi:IclR family transcriptional regulator [Devosia sp.]|uniref:IclR family transcriptional regulator n=1 Tax=Devosia sp. TaxID=1871048 RepID=UPI003265A639